MNKNIPTRLLTVIILCLTLFATANGQKQDSLVFRFKHLTVENGLTCNTIRALMQDKYGYVWIGSDYGLDRFDGHHITHLNGSKTNSTIQALCEVRDTVWIGCNLGLLYYSHHTDSAAMMLKKTREGIGVTSGVTGIQKDKYGNVWLSTMGQGVFCMKKNGTLKQYIMPDGGKNIANIQTTRKGDVWAISNWCRYNLTRYNSKKDQFEAVTPKFGKDNTPVPVNGIALDQDQNGNLWIGSWERGLIHMDTKTLKARTVLEANANTLRHIHDVKEYDNNNIYIGSDDGLCVYNTKKGTVAHYRDDELNAYSISDKFVYPIMKDHEGGVWVGTFYGGLNYTHPAAANFRNFTHSHFRNSINGNIISNIREDANGNLWIGSDDGGLSMYDKARKTFISYDDAKNGPTRNVHGLCVDGNTLYIGTYSNGLYLLDIKTGQEKHYQYFHDKDGNEMGSSSYAIFKDKHGTMWVGTFNSILTFDAKSELFERKKRIGTVIFDIKEDKDDNMWFATDGLGVWQYNHKSKKWTKFNSFKTNTEADSTATTSFSIYVDVEGTVWAGTSKGLFKHNRHDNGFTYVPLKDNGYHVTGVTGNNNELWLTTSAGLMKYSLKSNAVTRIYTSGDGLNNTNFIPNSIFMSSNGQVYLGTSHGLIAFTPDNMKDNNAVPKVVFTGMSIFNKPMKIGDGHLTKNLNEKGEIELGHKENSIRISFSAMSYVMPADNKYQYYLEGYESDWNVPTNDHYVTYTNLEPGTYTFHVRAANNDGVWNNDDTTLQFTIYPPIYWNTPIRCVYFILIVGIIWFTVRHMLKKKDKKHVAEIEELNTKNEQEVHEARIKFMTISDSDNAFLKKLEEVIERNFSDPNISVDFLASEMNVSRSGLFAKVKALADITPNEMIQIIRLKHAARLLETKEYRVNEICYMVGFNSPSYFAKCFQKHFGTKPAEYAK